MKYAFDNFIGNEYTKLLVKRTLENETFPQFSIFDGVFGTGKSTTAKIAAMRLTCESPKGAEPCCKCAACKNNMKAFETTGQSDCVKVVNLAKFEDKADVNNLIKDVFVLRSSSNAMIYIFEEVHALKNLKGVQTAFLEEIDRIPKNVYVIMCTTQGYDIIPELTSRAISFKFNRLTSSESRALTLRESDGRISPTAVNMVVRNTRGIPRDIIKSIDFIAKNQISDEEYREFIQEISFDELALMLLVMTEPGMASFVKSCDNLLEQREPGVIYRAFKEMLILMLFASEGANVELSVYCKNVCDDVFDTKRIEKCLSIVEQYNDRLSETDLRFLFYKVRLLMQGKNVKEVFASSSAMASRSKTEAKKLSAVAPVMEQKALNPIDLSKVSSFGGD